MGEPPPVCLCVSRSKTLRPISETARAHARVAVRHVSHLASCGLCRESGLGEEEVGPFTAQMSLMRAMCEESW